MEAARKSVKVQFKKDAADVVIAFYFNLIVQNSETNQWETVRKCYIAFGGNNQVKHSIEGEEHVFNVKPQLSIKKIAFFDPNEEEEEDRDKEHEAQAIMGAVNLLLKKQLKAMEQRVPMSALVEYAHIYFFGFEADFSLKFIPGFFEIAFNRFVGDYLGELGFDLVNTFQQISEGFYKANEKKRISFEKK